MKLSLHPTIDPGTVSPPSRGRGLKLVELVRNLPQARVAPFAGAWIETALRVSYAA